MKIYCCWICQYTSHTSGQVLAVAHFWLGALFSCFRSRPDLLRSLENELLKTRISYMRWRGIIHNRMKGLRVQWEIIFDQVGLGLQPLLARRMLPIQATLSSSNSNLPRMFRTSWLMSPRSSTFAGKYVANCPKFLLCANNKTSVVFWFSDILETFKTNSKKPFPRLYLKNSFGNSCIFSLDWSC